MTMPVDLPDDVERRVRAVADARGVSPEQLVLDAVRTEVGSGDGADDPFASVVDELRQLAFDGTLRSEIDATVHDTDLAVG